MKKLLVIATLLFSAQANAWTGTDLSVDYVDVKSSGHVSVYFKLPSTVTSWAQVTDINLSGCSQVGTVSWEGTNASAQNFLSAFLAAKMSETQVQILVDSGACLWGGWPKLLTVRMK